MSKKRQRKEQEQFETEVSVTQDRSPRIWQREKLKWELGIRDFQMLTEKQQAVIELAMDKHTRVLFIDGPAGSSKTFLSMLIGLKLLNTKKVSEMILVRSAVESASSSLGYLPGDIHDKFSVYMTPFHDKLQEFLPSEQIKKLEDEKRLVICPINFMRGLHFAVKFICCDEGQNLTKKELQTLMTRMGEHSKLIICGDTQQSDLPKGKSGFADVFNIFNDEASQAEGIYCAKFTHDDIVRSQLCKFIVEKFEQDAPKQP